ncbi:amphi-Trp domain-containing protein [Streptomyces sp. NPDC002466]|uniref:amphi-Trp domain-containing protein n=1 Tax=unclassified Streptomyces TaxID=2593676 RepID=UPI0011E67413|nr:amphi-Trp domain-containing protein [Streptomyces sp. sk2.1]TXS71344.1 amphi-Trp domain-containing protein [Streptomyces sp. sk2.1]
MKHLKFEQKGSLSRSEAAERLAGLADAFRKGGEAELELGTGVLSMRVPDEFRSEVEFEVGDGEIELEIELKWRTDGASGAPARKTERPEQPGSVPAEQPAPATRSRKAAPSAKPKRSAAKRS